MSYARHFSTRVTDQSEPIAGTVPNSAGGHAFPVDDWTRLERFLILGAEGGSYYATEQKLTRENAQSVVRCIAVDGQRVVATVVGVSTDGRAPKNDPAIFVLAMCAGLGDEKTKRAAAAALPLVCRIGTHLFQFSEAVQAFRGWGRGLRRAISGWYTGRDVDWLALQAVKYQQRNGWSHRDMLRLAHPLTDDMRRRAAFDWICRGTVGDGTPTLMRAFDDLKKLPTADAAVAAIRAHDLPREAIPTELLNNPDVWSALLERMPMTAMIRNLGKMTSIGVIKPFADAARMVCDKLADVEAIRKARVHPIAILVALRVYAQGRGERGSLTWTPVPQVVDALNAAFYTAFKAIKPTGKRILLALDVSGSMTGGQCGGMPLSPREGSVAMALMTAATEPNYHLVGFTAPSGSRPGSSGWSGYGGQHGGGNAELTPLGITPAMRLDTAVQAVERLPMGGTDCALPMLHALEKGLSVDAFVVYTDSETWAGKIHPTQALNLYRQKSGITAKLAVIGMVSNGFSIADPSDAGMMDFIGFDSAAPAVLADFIR